MGSKCFKTNRIYIYSLATNDTLPEKRALQSLHCTAHALARGSRDAALASEQRLPVLARHAIARSTSPLGPAKFAGIAILSDSKKIYINIYIRLVLSVCVCCTGVGERDGVRECDGICSAGEGRRKFTCIWFVRIACTFALGRGENNVL